MGHALPPGRETFDQKMEVRQAIEDAGIPYTYVVGACFAAYFAGNLSQMVTLLPPKEKVNIYGDGNVKGKINKNVSFNLFSSHCGKPIILNSFISYIVVFADEDDIAKYTAKTLNDPRTLNKTVNIRPPDNVLTQIELVQIWEKLTGNELEKTNIAAKDFLANIERKSNHSVNVVLLHF